MNSKRLQITLPYILLAIAFAVLATRAQYSFCWLDESFYLALADRFYNGATPFIDEWHPAQIYAPLLVPVYALYLQIVGSSEGVILFFRYVYLMLSFFTALITYRVLSREYGRFIACSIAISYLFYIRANIQGLSYYSLCTTFFLLALLCALCTWTRVRDGLDSEGEPGAARVLLPFFGGVFVALAIVCNPYVIAIFAIACLVALIWSISQKQMGHFIPFVWAIAGAAVVGVIYLWYVFMHASPADIVANLGNIFSSHDENLTALERIPNYFSYMPVSKTGFVGTCVLTVFMIVWRATKREMDARFRLVVLIIDCVLLVGTVGVGFFESLHPNKAFIAFVEFAIPIYLLNDDLRPSKHPELFLFWLPGILLSLVWQFSSNTQVCGIIIGFSIASYGAFITVMDIFRGAGRDLSKIKAEDDIELGRQLIEARLERVSHLIACCAIALIAVVCIVVRLTSVYSDSPFHDMDTTIVDGPAAGLITTAQHVDEYEGVRGLIGHIDDDSSVWIEPMAPWAYLECAGGCGVPSAWNTFPSDADFDVYYNRQGHAQPKWILVTDDNLGYSVNVVAGRMKSFPALEFYYEYTAELREKLAGSADYKPLVSNKYGTLYKHTEFSTIGELSAS